MSENGRPLLIVEDDPALQKQICWAFDQYETLVAADRESALAQVRRHAPPVVTMDLGLPPDPDSATEGFKLLEEILVSCAGHQGHRADRPERPSQRGARDRARRLRLLRQAVRAGTARADDRSRVSVCTTCSRRTAGCEAQRQPDAFAGLITRDPELLRICRLIEKVAGTRATVLLLGESGTGKEVLARALHDLSPRRAERFVAINCAAIPETLLESELFGYEKGAFTGAVKQTAGKIELANRGTLMLDEIGDLPLALQAKLLRFLQERVIERVGGRDGDPGRRAHRLRHPPGPEGPDRGRTLSRGPVLPAGGDRRHHPAAACRARATRRCSRTRSSSASQPSSIAG